MTAAGDFVGAVRVYGGPGAAVDDVVEQFGSLPGEPVHLKNRVNSHVPSELYSLPH